jgi:DNA-binding MarR family transcriptional regulator
LTYTKELGSLVKVFTVAREEMDSEVPTQMVEALLTIAMRPGISLQDLGKAINLSQSATSRNAQTLGKWHRAGKPGFDLVETIEDPKDTRRKLAFLTPKGCTVVGKLIGAATLSKPVAVECMSAHDYLHPIYKARMAR